MRTSCILNKRGRLKEKSVGVLGGGSSTNRFTTLADGKNCDLRVAHF